MVLSTSSTVLGSVKVGDLVSLNAKVSEFRSASRPNDLHLTELTSPANITVLSSGNPSFQLSLGETEAPQPSTYHLWTPARTVSCPSLRTKAFRTHRTVSYSQQSMVLISGKASRGRSLPSPAQFHSGSVTLLVNSGSGEAGVRPVLTVAGDCRSLSVRAFLLMHARPFGFYSIPRT
jgi:hypothetical protein